VRTTAKVLGAGGLAAGEHGFRVLGGHFLHCVDEKLARLGNGGLGGAVHGDDELVGVAPQPEPPHELLGSRQRFGQRDFDLRIAEEAVAAAKRRNRAAGTLLERRFEAGERLALGNAVQLG
jgi:hypothetical protein